MSFLEHFDRGGQVSMHRLRMRMQNFKIVLYTALIISFSYFCIKVYWDVHPYAWDLALEKIQADVYTAMPGKAKYTMEQRFKLEDGRYIKKKSWDVANDRLVNYSHVYITEHLISKAWQSLLVFISSCGFLFAFFMLRGKKKFNKKESRGAELSDPLKLVKLLRKNKQASDLNLDGVPFLKNAETQHTLLTGTTGAGKTNCFHTILPQIRERGDKALVIDVTGDYIQRYYRKGIDIILNPFDARSANWNIWNELKSDTDYDLFATGCISPSTHQEDFWVKAASKIFATGLQVLSKDKNPTAEKLHNILVKSDLKKYDYFFRGTDATPYVDIKGEKTTLSIRSTLSANIDFLKHLKENDGRDFSFREWLQDGAEEDEKPWVFISCNSTNMTSLRPLITAWFDLAVHFAMNLNPSFDRRIWFILDELSTLNKIPSLELGLTRLRKYGGCFLSGIQNIQQLNAVYGHEVAKTMLDTYNTKIFFRSTERQTCEWIAAYLGRKEETTTSENISYGAHAMRDGVSLNQQKSLEQLVLAEEIMELAVNECFLKIPGNYPAAKVKVSIKKLKKEIAAPFVEKDEAI